MKEYIIDFDQLYDSASKCKRNVSWKPSVKAFMVNSIENCYQMNEELENGTWKNRKPKPLTITKKKALPMFITGSEATILDVTSGQEPGQEPVFP